jgi:hypothetical protein
MADLKPYALTTLENLREHLDRTEDTTDNEDGELVRLINAKSNAIKKWCEREFTPPDPAHPEAIVSRDIEYLGKGRLSLAPYDLRELVSISVDGVELDVGARILHPVGQTTDGTYLSLELRTRAKAYYVASEYSSGFFGGGGLRKEAVVTIEGKWGMAEIPPDVEHYCLMACAHDFTSPFGFGAGSRGRQQFSELSASDFAGGLPLPVLRGLRTYKRVEID